MRKGLTAGGGMVLGLVLGIATGHMVIGMVIGLLIGTCVAAARWRRAPELPTSQAPAPNPPK